MKSLTDVLGRLKNQTRVQRPFHISLYVVLELIAADAIKPADQVHALTPNPVLADSKVRRQSDQQTLSNASSAFPSTMKWTYPKSIDSVQRI